MFRSIYCAHGKIGIELTARTSQYCNADNTDRSIQVILANEWWKLDLNDAATTTP